MTPIILYGPPASGKSTITRLLSTTDSAFRLFKRIKVGRGRTEEYRMISLEELQRRRANGEILWENRRYGSTYAVDRPELARMARDHSVPVLHVGQREAVALLTRVTPFPWFIVSLTCPRDVAFVRIASRATGDMTDRQRAWEETEPLHTPDLEVDTSTCSPAEAADLIKTTYARRDVRGL